MRKSANLTQASTTVDHLVTLVRQNSRTGYENGKQVVVIDLPLFEALIGAMVETVRLLGDLACIFLVNGD